MRLPLTDELRAVRDEIEVRLLAKGTRVPAAALPPELAWFRAGPTVTPLYFWEFARDERGVYGRLTDALTGRGGCWRLPRDPDTLALLTRLLAAWSGWAWQAAARRRELLARTDARSAA